MSRSARSAVVARTRRGMSWLWVLVVLVLAGGGTWYFFLRGEEKVPEVQSEFEYVVRRSDFIHEVTELGELRSSQNVEIRCEVESRGGQGVAILELIPEGTYVQPGTVLAKLDSSALEEEYQQQQIVVSASEARVTQARNEYETALIAKQEYLEGTYKQEEQQIRSEILVAEENLRRAEEYLKYSQRLAARGYITPAQLEADRFAVEKARTELETARVKLFVLQNYTKAKMLKQLEAEIQSAQARLKSETRTYQLDLERLKHIEQQIKNCTIVAPTAGEVVYANDRNPRGSEEVAIIEGAFVRERQVMFHLPDPKNMEVRARINETRIALVREGMPATIRLDARRNRPLRGTVSRVERYPIPNRWSSIKNYYCYVKIEETVPGLRPGMSAEVRIRVREEPDVLQIPLYAVVAHGKKHLCVVKTTEGGRVTYTPREIELGPNNERFVIVRSGLKEGEVVMLNPRQYLDLPKTVEDPKQYAQKRRGRRGPGRGGPGGKASRGRPGRRSEQARPGAGGRPPAGSGRPKRPAGQRPGGPRPKRPAGPPAG